MDLWDYGLSPQEFMAAHYLEKVAGRASGREIAERLDVSRRTGERILSSLVDKGVILRVRQARYALLWMTQSASPVTQSASPMTQTKVLSTTSSKSVLVGMSDDIPTSAARPSEGDHIKKRFPMADDLEPGRLKPKPPEKPRRAPLKVDKYHRLTQPREEWGVPHVVKEFGIRYQHAFPESIYVVEGKSLSVMLNWCASHFGLTVPQMMTALDQFFDHHASKVPDDKSPTRYFLQYLKDYIRQQPEFKNVDFDSATLEGDSFE